MRVVVVVGAIVDVPNAAFRDGVTLLRFNEIELKGSYVVGFNDSLESVFEVDVPSDAIASAVDIVDNFSIIGDGG